MEPRGRVALDAPASLSCCRWVREQNEDEERERELELGQDASWPVTCKRERERERERRRVEDAVLPHAVLFSACRVPRSGYHQQNQSQYQSQVTEPKKGGGWIIFGAG